MNMFTFIFGAGRYAAGGLRAATVMALVLLLLRATGMAQAPATTTDDPPSPTPLFKNVIANEERCERKLDDYERVMRTEARKGAAEANTVETKVWRMFPIGT
jgi:hypothetical protein